MCELWLEDKYGFKTTKPWEFEKGEEISEHKQLRDALYDYGEIYIKSKLFQLSNLRKKADYEPFIDITPKEVTDSITHMKNIINKLEFD